MIILSLLAIIFLFTVSLFIGAQGSISWFIDAPSFIVLIIGTFIILLSSGLLKDFGRAFKICLSKKDFSENQLNTSITALSLVIKTLFTISGLLTVISIIQICGHLSDISLIGPNLAISLLSFVYSFIIVLILIPLRATIQKKLINK